MRLAALTLAALLALGCRTERVTVGDDARRSARPAVVTGDLAADRATLERLEREAAAIVRTDGCAEGDCATAPVGAKACGGPRYYLVYCRRTTDVPALERKLAELEAFERAFNLRHRIYSTCEMAMPPQVGLVGGECRAAR